MTVDIGFNFRATLGYVTDGAGETHVVADTYPVTRAGYTFGWTTAVDSRDRVAGNDRRLAGINFQANNGTQAIFRVNVPAGTYKIRLAIGDGTSAQAKQYVQIRDADGTTPLLTIDDTNGTSTNNFTDAAGANYTQAAWAAGNSEATITTTGAQFFVRVGTPTAQTDSSTLAHLRVVDAVTPPTAGFTTAIDRKQVTATSTASAGSNPITTTEYDYGDGSGRTASASHIYSVGGTYTITQYVNDGVTSEVSTTNNVTTKTRYRWRVTTVGGSSATVTADRPDA